MPIVTIGLIEGRSKEQKSRIVAEFTDTLVRVAGVKPENVRIVITDHSKDNLAMGGKLLSDRPEFS
ncbi:MAG: 2-hydroxymuconate tautomerase family protein [Deltaproteobacteria bacterium]|nr:2-hydroxymuconate tautomerase family protein [Deltaproteobacteria bacterium]